MNWIELAVQQDFCHRQVVFAVICSLVSAFLFDAEIHDTHKLMKFMFRLSHSPGPQTLSSSVSAGLAGYPGFSGGIRDFVALLCD